MVFRAASTFSRSAAPTARKNPPLVKLVLASDSHVPRRVVDTHGFDTYGSSSAAGQLATYVEGLSSGALIAVAVKDEAAMRLYSSALDALSAAFGIDLSGLGIRASYAALAIKGDSSA